MLKGSGTVTVHAEERDNAICTRRIVNCTRNLGLNRRVQEMM